MERTISVRSDQNSNILGPSFKVVDFDRSAHFGWLDRDVSFPFDKVVAPGTALLYPAY